MQHRLNDFSLADRTRKGHLKMLLFYIVDPYNKGVFSTDQIPPQQSDWAWEEAVLNNNSLLMRELPVEVLGKIFDNVKWPMTLKAAKELRMQLARERFAINRTMSEDHEEGLGVFTSQHKVRLQNNNGHGHENRRQQDWVDRYWTGEIASEDDESYFDRYSGGWNYRNE